MKNGVLVSSSKKLSERRGEYHPLRLPTESKMYVRTYEMVPANEFWAGQLATIQRKIGEKAFVLQRDQNAIVRKNWLYISSKDSSSLSK